MHSSDEQDKQITTISSWLEPKGSPKISPGTGDDGKAKSTAMSRLLAVDSDNYMLRKGTATITTTATNGATTSPSATSSSSCPSSSSTLNVNGSTSVQMQRQIQSLAIGSTNVPPILATYSNGGDHVVGQLYDVARAASRSAATYASSRWYAAGNNNQAVRQYWEGATAAVTVAQLEEQSLQQSQQQQQLQLQSRAATATTTETTTLAASVDGFEGEFGFARSVCARPVSFHRYLCWCGVQQQSAVAEDIDANSIGDGRAKGGRGTVTHEGELAARRTVRDDSNNSSSLCCCMCGSLCPAECHACFHIKCSDYSGQHLCQWTTKGHALPGQVHDKDKVSSKVMLFRCQIHTSEQRAFSN